MQLDATIVLEDKDVIVSFQASTSLQEYFYNYAALCSSIRTVTL